MWCAVSCNSHRRILSTLSLAAADIFQVRR
jgi:hypothetical protein